MPRLPEAGKQREPWAGPRRSFAFKPRTQSPAHCQVGTRRWAAAQAAVAWCLSRVNKLYSLLDFTRSGTLLALGNNHVRAELKREVNLRCSRRRARHCGCFIALVEGRSEIPTFGPSQQLQYGGRRTSPENRADVKERCWRFQLTTRS